MNQNWLTIEIKKDGSRKLTKCAKEAEGEIVIPEGVREIGAGAFKDCDKITSLIMPDGLRYVDHLAFCDHYRSFCPSLSTIHFPSNLLTTFFSSLECKMFMGTAWYDSQPDGVIYAGVNVIGYKGRMPKKAEIVIQEGTKFISHSAFKNCQNVEKIVLPKSLVYIDKFAFNGCRSLATITFTSDVELSGSSVIEKTLWYQNQPQGVVYAGANAIGYKGKMPEKTEIVIKEGTKYISFRAFASQNNLEKVTLPQSIVKIGIKTFQYCENLKTIYIPKVCNIETIGESWLTTIDNTLSQLLFQSGLKETEWVPNSNRMMFARKTFQ